MDFYRPFLKVRAPTIAIIFAPRVLQRSLWGAHHYFHCRRRAVPQKQRDGNGAHGGKRSLWQHARNFSSGRTHSAREHPRRAGGRTLRACDAGVCDSLHFHCLDVVRRHWNARHLQRGLAGQRYPSRKARFSRQRSISHSRRKIPVALRVPIAQNVKPASAMSDQSQPDLVKGLGVFGATSVVAGTMIGTAVFVVPGIMLAEVKTPSMVLLVFLAAGVLSLFGALAYAELGAALPQAGGEFVYMHRAYGPLFGFLYGWTQFIIAKTASIAAIATGFVLYLAYFFPRLHDTVVVGLIPFGARRVELPFHGPSDRRDLDGPVSFRTQRARRPPQRSDSNCYSPLPSFWCLPFSLCSGFSYGHGSWSSFHPILPAGGHAGLANRIRHRNGFRALGLRRMEQPQHGGGRGQEPPAQYSARAHRRIAPGPRRLHSREFCLLSRAHSAPRSLAPKR